MGCECLNNNRNPLPDADFLDFWNKKNELSAASRRVDIRPAEFSNPMARYYEVTFPGTDGAPLYARYICPASASRVPTVLMYHDYGRGIRGWHHMTRFPALGYAVFALENRCTTVDISEGWQNAPETLTAAQLYTDALTAAHAARTLPEVDPSRLITWGEGLGGGLAIAAAAMVPGVIKCAALNPLPADFRTVRESGCDSGFYSGLRTHFRSEDPQHIGEETFFRALGYLDCSSFASLLKCPVLMGTGSMDTVSPAASQNTVIRRITSEAKHLIYPKYGHERINFYEDELLKFFR